MVFSDTVRLIRKRLDLSQEQLARELNISFSTVNRWEKGKNQPSQMAIEIFRQFCKDNNIEMDDITEMEEQL